MARYILLRLAGLIPVLLVLSMLTFALMHEVPGGPWKEGQRPFSEAQLAALKARYGLDKPVWQQYRDLDLRRRPAGPRHVVQAPG